MNKKLTKQAREYIELKEEKARIDKRLKELEKDLLVKESDIFVEKLGKKLTYIAPKIKTEINSSDLIAYLIKHRRTNDVKEFFSITEKNLLKMKDGENLIKEYKVKTGLSTKASFRIVKLSKEDVEV